MMSDVCSFLHCIWGGFVNNIGHFGAPTLSILKIYAPIALFLLTASDIMICLTYRVDHSAPSPLRGFGILTKIGLIADILSPLEGSATLLPLSIGGRPVHERFT